MIYKIITEIYLVQVMLVAIVYYKIKSIKSLMWGKDCNMQILQTSGKSCHSVSENASPERCCRQVPDCTYRGSSRCCVISRTHSSVVCVHCHLPNVTARLHFVNYFLFHQECSEILTCIANLILIYQSRLLQKILTSN